MESSLIHKSDLLFNDDWLEDRVVRITETVDQQAIYFGRITTVLSSSLLLTRLTLPDITIQINSPQNFDGNSAVTQNNTSGFIKTSVENSSQLNITVTQGAFVDTEPISIGDVKYDIVKITSTSS